MKIRNKNQLSLFLTLAFAGLSLLLGACSGNNKKERLPVLGHKETVERTVNGQTVTDTIYSEIPDFAFINQDSQVVANKDFAGKLYIADFFFTTCPTICPKMKSQMLRVYEKFKDNPDVMFLSHTIDPKHDTVAVLRDYAERLQVSSEKWHFVTGDKDAIFEIAEKYMVSAMEDEKEAGGLVHSGAFILVDENRRIRGVYDGTMAEQVDQLMLDIPVLLKEMKGHAKQ